VVEAKAVEDTIIIKQEDADMGTILTAIGLMVEPAKATLQSDQVAEIQIAMTVALLVADSTLSSIKVEAIMLEASITITMAARISTTTRGIILEVEIRRATAAMATMVIMVDTERAAIMAIIVTTADTMVLAVMAATVSTVEVQEATTPAATRIIITSSKCNSIKAITTTTIWVIMTVNPRHSHPSSNSSNTHNQTHHNNTKICSTAKTLKAKGPSSPLRLRITPHRIREATRPQAANSHLVAALRERPCSNPPPNSG